MDSGEIVACLMRVPIFGGLQQRQIEEVARRGQRRTFEPGETIIEAGEQGDAAYLVLHGECGSHAGADPIASPEPIEPGSLLGELAMLVDHAYGVTVVAATRVDCLKLERSALCDQMCADPAMADCLAQVIRERLARLASELQEIDDLLAAAAQIAPAMPLPLLPPPSQPAAINAAA
ncbi:MAG TPA: cyclic nucleotide-binding domain-containing protein [Hyphomicrobiaceae bacterium]|nr:cyclic nucleotide-binding domain-containing protein [Hyphomicrobiaceae bacterium]